MIDVFREVLYIDHLLVNFFLFLRVKLERNSPLHLCFIFRELEHFGLLNCKLDQTELFHSVRDHTSTKYSFRPVKVQKEGEIKLCGAFKLPLQEFIFSQIGVTKVKLKLVAKLINNAFLVALYLNTAHVRVLSVALYAEDLTTSPISDKIRVRVHVCTQLPLLVLVVSLPPLHYLNRCSGLLW